MVVLGELRAVLVDFGPQEPVEAPEALAERPEVERADRRDVFDRGEVPLPESHGGIALRAQHRRQHRRLFRDPAVVAGKTAGELHDRTNPDRMMVPAGQQCCARRRAHRVDVEVVVEDPGSCQLVDVRGLDAPPEASVATEVTEARVVQDNDDDVGLGYGKYLISRSRRACRATK